MDYISVGVKRIINMSISMLSLLLFIISIGSSTLAAQSRSVSQKPCVQFSDLQAGPLTSAQQQEAKIRVRKYLLESWEANKKTCADLAMHSPNGASFKWTYTISFDKSHKKQLAVQFFDKGTLQSTQTVFTVRRWQNDPNFALELLDENGRQIGIL